MPLQHAIGRNGRRPPGRSWKAWARPQYPSTGNPHRSHPESAAAAAEGSGMPFFPLCSGLAFFGVATASKHKPVIIVHHMEGSVYPRN